MARVRFSSPLSVNVTVADIESFVFYPASNGAPARLEATFVLKREDGAEHHRETVYISPIPAQAVTALTAIVTRIFTFLQNQGYIPAGSEE